MQIKIEDLLAICLTALAMREESRKLVIDIEEFENIIDDESIGELLIKQKGNQLIVEVETL